MLDQFFREQIVQVIERRGRGTMADLARKTGWDASYISRMLSGEREITLERADLMAQRLGLRLVMELVPDGVGSHAQRILAVLNRATPETREDLVAALEGLTGTRPDTPHDRIRALLRGRSPEEQEEIVRAIGMLAKHHGRGK